MSDEFKHYGMPRRSGRYPWGSGKDPNQSASDFRSHIQELKRKGLSEVEIARGEGLTTSQLRKRISLVKDEVRSQQAAQALRLKDKGYSNMEIGRKMNINESSVRSLLDPSRKERNEITRITANMLKESVDQNRFIDIGAGVENHIGITRTRLNTAVSLLQEEGYQVHRVNVPQVGSANQFTIVKVLGAPDTKWKEIVRPEDFSKIKSITAYSDDFGRSYTSVLGLKPVQSISSDRVQVVYGKDGGSSKDGVIELRRGTEDLSLGGSNYAQVRISVDGTHYLKGMAIYSDDLPDGIDVRFNTNKVASGNKLDAMKPLKDDPDNPFGSTIKAGGQRGAINIVNEEGDWDSWSRTISSQVLSKQTVPLAKTQLDLGYKIKKEEHAEISSLTNPLVKKQLLLAFADDCDASAVHLKAAGLPRQASKVILPIPDLKENEVYAPTFRNGETVVLIRHPHGGIFEIPQLKVNNKSVAAKNVMANAPDAIGINPKTAQRLSGADFDGDTVIVIPNNAGLIRTSASLKGLQNFDPIEAYPGFPGMSKISPKTKQTKMGEISNLITDMTIKGANVDEIARAVRHSMVVIDSEKHNLNYKQSYIDNGIAALSEKYQNSKRGGASTLISRAGSELRVPQRKAASAIGTGLVRVGIDTIDPKTGEKIYTLTGSTYVDKKGRMITKTTATTRMGEAKDAATLSSGRQIELVYAGYANELKELAKQSRIEALAIKQTPYSPSAKLAYNQEVSTLNAKLNLALKNKPLERQAQIVANTVIESKRQANPDMAYEDLKKVKNQALAEARTRTGAKKNQISITSREWEAIQAGAISSSKLEQILQNANLDTIKQLATPRSTNIMSASKIAMAQAMLTSGYTQAEVAERFGISVTTLNNSIK